MQRIYRNSRKKCCKFNLTNRRRSTFSTDIERPGIKSLTGGPALRAFTYERQFEANNFLRNLALKIDRHVVEHFFVIEVL